MLKAQNHTTASNLANAFSHQYVNETESIIWNCNLYSHPNRIGYFLFIKTKPLCTESAEVWFGTESPCFLPTWSSWGYLRRTLHFAEHMHTIPNPLFPMVRRALDFSPLVIILWLRFFGSALWMTSLMQRLDVFGILKCCTESAGF